MGSAHTEANIGAEKAEETVTLTHLQRLEAESIHIMREVVAEAENPVMLYSIGKDSAAMLHVAKKAFYPSPPPFPLLHVDTTWKFKDMYALREKAAADAGMKLIVHKNPDAEAQRHKPVRSWFPAHGYVENGRLETGTGHARLRRGFWRRAAR